MPLPDFTAGTVLTAAALDAAFLSLFPLGIDGWTPYTPTWRASGTQPVLGNGSLIGVYTRAGRSIDFRIGIAMGSTTTYGTGTYSFDLPVPAATGEVGYVAGRAAMVDASAGVRAGRDVLIGTATAINLSSEAGAFVGQTVPWTWANTDYSQARGRFEAAS